MGYFENADHVSAGVSDYALRMWLAEGLAEDETGAVDECGGHIALMNLDPDTVAKMANEQGDPYLAQHFTPGWYLVMSDEFGFVYGNYYTSEALARRDFATAEWLQANGEEQ